MIKNKKYRLVLDLKKNFVSAVETLVQNDVNTNEFEIELFDDGVPYLIDEKNKLEVAAKKSDGTVVVDSATGIQNTVSWQLSEQALTASGYVEAEVRVLEDTGVLTASQSFKFLVRPNLINDETIKSTSQYRALDEAVKKAEELKKELDGVPEKVAEIKSEFDNVKTTLENTQKELLAGLQISNKNIDEIKTYLNGVNAEIQKIKDKEIDIANLRALLANLEDLKARLATLENTLSDAKTTNTNLEKNIKTSNKNISDMNALINTARDVGSSLTSDTTAGKSVDAALKGSITKGNQIVANVNNADKTITEKINTATTTGQSLDESVQKGSTTKTNLDESIKTAETTKTNLDSLNTTATSTKTELDKSIELAKTRKTELDGSISTGATTKAGLDSSIKTGKDVNTKSASLKAELDGSVANATNAKTELDTSTNTAKNVKTELDGSIASAGVKNTELKGTTTTAESTDTEAKKTIETLQALLTKSEGSEQSLREIIASGNLDKYVTDPKLQETLKDYATKKELENIDVTSKLGDYALKKDVKTKLSEMVEDETHRTVTDTEKTSWNGKAEKTDIPTKLSELTNDETFKTEAEIRTLIESSSKLKKSVVDKLPTTGKEDLIYLVKDTKGKTGNIYLEYLWINNAFELIGSTSVDLSGYAKTEDLKDYAKKIDIRPEAKFKTMTAVIDQSNSNPLTCITYEDDAKFMEKGSKDWDEFFKSQLVLFKDGKEVRELKDEELNGLTEADGDVMVRFPRKGLSIKTVGDKVYVSMTDNPDSEDFKYYAHTRGTERREAFYIGAYLGYEKDGKLRSIKGFEPTGNKTIGDFRTIAQANGTGYEQLAFYQWTFLQAMYVLKYGNLDSQTALGKGLTNGSSYLNTGGTNGKGIDFGYASGISQMRFQYIEDFWGNKVQWLDGCKTNSGSFWVGADKFNNNGDGYRECEANNVTNTYPKKIWGDSARGFLAKEMGGSTSTYYCDYVCVKPYNDCFSCVGGFYGSQEFAGAFYFYCDCSASETNAFIGGRLMFL